MDSYKMIINFVQNNKAGDFEALKEIIELMFLRNENAVIKKIEIKAEVK